MESEEYDDLYAEINDEKDDENDDEDCYDDIDVNSDSNRDDEFDGVNSDNNCDDEFDGVNSDNHYDDEFDAVNSDNSCDNEFDGVDSDSNCDDGIFDYDNSHNSDDETHDDIDVISDNNQNDSSDEKASYSEPDFVTNPGNVFIPAMPIFAHDTPSGYDDSIDSIDENIYKQALASGSVPINRCRVMVVGQDGAGKSCLIDSFLDRPFNAQSPSTDGAAIHMAVTAAKGRVGQHTWREEKCENAQYLDKYLAAGYVITKKQDQVKKTALSPIHAVSFAKRKKIRQCSAITDEPQSDESLEDDASASYSVRDLSSSPATQELDQHIREITKDEKVTSEQREMIAEYLKSSEALATLENFEVSSKLLWDLGGQERYLTSHAALMPTESEYTVCTYLLVIDISKPLGDKAKSSYRLGGTSTDIPLELSSLLYNRDFPRHWFTSIGISHPSNVSSPYLGEDLRGVSYPAVLIAATHIDEVKAMPNPEEFLKSQNAQLDNLIHDLKCEDHIVKNPKNGQWFFRVDNTKSGRSEAEERCEGVRTIVSLLDSSSKYYWSQKNKTRPMPLAWIRFEISLVLWKIGKILSVKTAIKLAHRVGIKSIKEALLALKFLHNLGVILYFWDVPELTDRVIIDPEWLIRTVATFVTVKEPKKVKYQRLWRKLCETGDIGRDVVLNVLEEAGVEPRDQEPVLNVLKMLDIICDSPEAFLIPCMVTQKLSGSSVWEKYDPREAFPPPIVICPKDVQAIPEALFFRLVTKCARKYPGGCELTRNRCLFRIGSNLVLELLYYDRGACLIVSMAGERNTPKNAVSVSELAYIIGQFVADSVENAKKRGMNGLKLAFYYQVTECILGLKSDDGGAGNVGCRLPDGDFLVQLPDRECCKSGRQPLSLLCKSGKYAPKEKLELVHLWYKKENLSPSESQAGIPEREPTREERNNLSEKIASTWKDVARRLELPEATIEQIATDYACRCREQAHQALQRWVGQESKSASVKTLCKALCKEGKKAVAAEIFSLDDEVLSGLLS